MPPDSGSLKNWFGYSRQERRASLVLLILIAGVLIFRMSIPENDMEIMLELVASTGNDIGKSEIPVFDPNTAALDTLLLAGLNEHEAATLLNYRNKGGMFRKPSDIRKIYGIDSAKASDLIPYIIIDNKETESTAEQKMKTELNSCDSAALEKLPGIGPVLSARIIKYRNLLGGFVSVSQLREVYGLNEQTFKIVSPHVIADTSGVRKIMINTAEFSELIRMPYLSRYQVNAILKYRELTGTIHNIEELKENLILPDSTAGKVRSYLDFSSDQK